MPRSSGALAGSSSGRNGAVEPTPYSGSCCSASMSRACSLVQGTSGDIRVYSNPLPITPALLARGRERFNIYCAPCHSAAGDGDGMIVRRGFPAPPSYHTDRLRNAPDSHFYQVISNGYGAMYPYADRIAPQIAGRSSPTSGALQLSQHAPARCLSAGRSGALQGPAMSAWCAGTRVRNGSHCSIGVCPACSPVCCSVSTSPQQALLSYLFAFLFFTGLSARESCVGVGTRADRGAWGNYLRPHLLAAARMLPLQALLVLPILSGHARAVSVDAPDLLAGDRCCARRAGI